VGVMTGGRASEKTRIHTMKKTEHQRAVEAYPDWLLERILEDYSKRVSPKTMWEFQRIAAIEIEIKRRRKNRR
jgi:hypothetical protein